jgi:hypothetical protein
MSLLGFWKLVKEVLEGGGAAVGAFSAAPPVAPPPDALSHGGSDCGVSAAVSIPQCVPGHFLGPLAEIIVITADAIVRVLEMLEGWRGGGGGCWGSWCRSSCSLSSWRQEWNFCCAVVSRVGSDCGVATVTSIPQCACGSIHCCSCFFCGCLSLPLPAWKMAA